MHSDIPTREPASLIAGTTWRWDRFVSGHGPGDGWALTYYFSGPAPFTVAAGGTGSVFEVRQAAADSAEVAAGTYTVAGIASKAGESHAVYSGRIAVAANPATLAGDTRTFAERMLEAVEAALAGREIPEYESLEINGRGVKYLSREELYRERARLLAEVQAGRGTMPLVIRQAGGFRRAY